jgi:hypothetical protein
LDRIRDTVGYQGQPQPVDGSALVYLLGAQQALDPESGARIKFNGAEITNALGAEDIAVGARIGSLTPNVFWLSSIARGCAVLNAASRDRFQ